MALLGMSVPLCAAGRMVMVGLAGSRPTSSTVLGDSGRQQPRCGHGTCLG